MRWDDLNMGDKSRMIQLAVDSGITDLRTIRDVFNSYAEGGGLDENPNSTDRSDRFKKFVAAAAERAFSNEQNARRVAAFAERHPKTTAKISRAVRSIIPEDNLFSAAVLAHKHAWSPDPLQKLNAEYSLQKAPVESPTGAVYGEWADPGNSYLLPPKSQQKYMERLGYKMRNPETISETDYGLVRRAVTSLEEKLGRAIPIYQRGEDYTTRENLVPIYNGNNDEAFYEYIMQYDKDYRETGLSHAGAYPFALYQIPGKKEYVYKAWDLNDYGNHTPGGTTYGASETIDEKDHQYLANLYDILGEPFVQTTGYTYVPGLSGKTIPSKEEYNKIYNKVIESGKYTMDKNKAKENGYYTNEETMKRDIDAAVAKQLFNAGYIPFISNVYAEGTTKPNKIWNKADGGNLLAMGGKPKRRKTLITELPEVTVTPQWLKYWDATPEQTRTLTNRNGKYNTTSMGDKGYTHFDTISARYKGLNAAMQRANFSDEEMGRLSPFLLTQLALEGGWVIDRPDNNFGGMMSGGKRIEFDTEDSFYDAYLKNLDARWGDEYLGKGKGWRNAKTINEYADIINREDLGLHTKEAFDEYNRKHRDHPAYIYTPLWENNNTGLMDENKFGGIYDRALGNYELLMKRMGEWDKFAKNNKIFAK